MNTHDNWFVPIQNISASTHSLYSVKRGIARIVAYNFTLNRSAPTNHFHPKLGKPIKLAFPVNQCKISLNLSKGKGTTMTLGELAAKSGIAAEQIATFTRAGLLPCKDTASLYSDNDLYWLDMVNCFVENGSSVAELKNLMPLCETRV